MPRHCRSNYGCWCRTRVTGPVISRPTDRSGPGRGPADLPWPVLVAAAVMLGYLVVPFLALIGALPQADVSQLLGPTTTDALRVSLIAATVATLLDGLLGIPLGLWLATTQSRFRHLATAAVVLPLAVPPVVGGLELMLVIGRATWLGSLLERYQLNPLDTVVGTILAQMFVGAPFVVISARAAFASIDPVLVDAARSLGSSPMQTFLRVLLPAARRGIAAGMLLGWVRCLGEFGATAVLAYHPYTLPTLTFVSLSGGGIRSAIGPGLLVALVGAASGTVLLWLEARGRTPRVDVAEPGITGADVTSLPWVVGGEERGTGVEVDIRARVGEFDLAPRFEASSAMIGVLGPSGSGKSLTLRALAGLLPVQGCVRVEGVLMLDAERGVALAPEHRQLGYVFQHDALFEHLNVERNIAFGIDHLPREQRQRRVDELVRALGLRGLARVHPRRLSGGERQRVALARALATGPRALLLDESFSYLDAHVKRQLRDLVRQLHERTGIPVILVTHDREDVADLCDYVVVMQRGRVVQQGSVHEVFTNPASRAVAQLVGVPNILQVRRLERAGTDAVAVTTDWGL